MDRHTLAVVAGILLAQSPGTGAARAEPAASILSGFEVDRARAVLGRPLREFHCPPPAEPLLDMSGFKSRYDPKDPTQSRVDPARERSEADRSRRLGTFAADITRLADLAVLSRPANPQIAACTLQHLSAWARADALMGSAAANDEIGRHQAVMTQAWQLSTYAAVLDKIGGQTGGLPAADLAAVRAWFVRLAGSVMAEYVPGSPWSRHGANHLYWAGVGVGLAGTAVQSAPMRDFAVEALNRGLDDVDANGALKGEMTRGARAAIYQNFATLGLTALVRFADANGVALTPERERALTRLLALDAAQTREPATIEARTTVRQVPARDRTSLAWIDVILPRLRERDPGLAASLDKLATEFDIRPARHPFLGGNVSLVYNPADWHPVP